MLAKSGPAILGSAVHGYQMKDLFRGPLTPVIVTITDNGDYSRVLGA